MNSRALLAGLCFWLGAASPWASEPLLRAADFPSHGWETHAPRQEITPKFSVDAKGGRGKSSALKIDLAEESEYGAWRTKVEGIVPGKHYKFEAWFRALNVSVDRRSIIPRLQWLDAQGKSLRAPDFAIDTTGEGEWKRVTLITPAPEKAAAVDVQLAAGFARSATVWWDDISLGEAVEVPNRTVRAVTIYHRPARTKSAAESVEQFCHVAERSRDSRPDIICLPEGITVIGTGKSYAEVSEPIPGPTSERLGKLARSLGSYIVAGIYERENEVVYNTAILVGRDGKLAGKYRKTHLPREEWEAGITPGNEYPVFDTDFGKVGLIVCWDVQFPEPSRAMAAQGAEILLLPIWGGSETLAKARAIENHVFLVSSSYDMKTFIVAPNGEVLAEAGKEQPIAAAELRLDSKIFQPWLGDMKNRTWKERRPDIPVEAKLSAR